jgi:hypothetical protein
MVRSHNFSGFTWRVRGVHLLGSAITAGLLLLGLITLVVLSALVWTRLDGLKEAAEEQPKPASNKKGAD